MLVNLGVLEELYNEAGTKREEKAENYIKEKRVNVKKVIYEDKDNFEIRSKVRGNNEIYDVYIKVEKGEIDNITCNCPDYYEHYGTCKHILATAIEFSRNESYIRIFSGEAEKKQNDIALYEKYQKKEEQYRNFKQLIHTFYPNSLEEQNENKSIIPLNSIKLEPKLIYNSYLKTLKLEVKIGNKQLYKIKNIAEFYDRMQKKEYFRYGSKLEFVHEEGFFEEKSKPLLQYILKYGEIIKYTKEQTNKYSYYGRTIDDNFITISNSGMDELFDVFETETIKFQKDGKEEEVLFVNSNPNLEFTIQEEGKNEYSLIPNIDVYSYEIMEGRKYTYFEQDNVIYRCDEQFINTTLKLLQVFRNNFTNKIAFPKNEISKLFSVVFPKVRNQINTEKLKDEEIQKYIPKELYVKTYLDYNEKNYITAEIKFVYGEDEFNPLKEDFKIPRDIAKEDEVLELFKQSGFMLDVENSRLILVNDEYIYQFLSQDIEIYMKKFEVLATDNFKQKEIKSPKIGSLGVKIENNLLNIDLSDLDFDISELEEIMKKYRLKKKYHRLKDGNFLSLEENDTITLIDSITSGMDIEYKELEKAQLKLPIYRSLYLDRILDGLNSININKDENYNGLINKIEKKEFSSPIEVPKDLKADLRNYQKIGYEWLNVIDQYNFGGILADDMGLRKNTSINCSNIKLC